jgi:hypothetical protein
MSKINMFVLISMLCGCGAEDLCQASDLKFGGLCIQEGFDIQEQDINRMMEVIETETQYYYPEVVNIVDKFAEEKIRVEFIDGNLAFNCEEYERDVYECDDYIYGINYDSHMIYVSYNECIGNTALAHELLHSIDHFYLGAKYDKDKSNDHSTPWLFTEYIDIEENINILDIVEIRVAVNLMCTLEKCSNEFSNTYMCIDVWPVINNSRR